MPPNKTTAIEAATKEKIHEWLSNDKVKAGLRALLRGAMPPETLGALILNLFRSNPQLSGCSFESIVSGVLNAAALGLEMGTPLADAYLIPRNIGGRMEACFQVGYRGLITLARRSGSVSHVEAGVVYRGDEFTWRKGSDPYLHHWYDVEADRPDTDVLAAYMVVVNTGGQRAFEVIGRKAIEARQKMSKTTRSDSPWKLWYAEMVRKAAILYGKYLLPANRDLGRALDLDADDTGDSSVATVFGNIPTLEEGQRKALGARSAALADRAEAEEDRSTSEPPDSRRGVPAEVEDSEPPPEVEHQEMAPWDSVDPNILAQAITEVRLRAKAGAWPGMLSAAQLSTLSTQPKTWDIPSLRQFAKAHWDMVRKLMGQ